MLFPSPFPLPHMHTFSIHHLIKPLIKFPDRKPDAILTPLYNTYCANFTIYYIIKFLFCWDEVYVNLLPTFLIMLLVCSLTSRAEFPSANAVMDGFGGADLTISKLRHSQW